MRSHQGFLWHSAAGALCLLAGLGAQAAEVWSVLSTPAAGSGATPTVSGTLGGQAVTFTSNAGSSLLHLPSAHAGGEYLNIWDNATTGTFPVSPFNTFSPNNANVYPASAQYAVGQVVMGAGATANQVTIQFAQAVTDPIVLVYSVERGTTLSFANTVTTASTPVVIDPPTMNPAGSFTAATNSFTSAPAAGTFGWALEGCSQNQNFPTTDTSKISSRACGSFQLRGSYKAIVLNSNRNDGIGLQVGYNAPLPVVVNESHSAVNDVETTTAPVIGNDSINGQPAVLTGTGTNASLVPGSAPVGTAISMGATGAITIPVGTPPGTYSYLYQVCMSPATAPPLCAPGTATIVVTAPTVKPPVATAPTPVPVGGWGAGVLTALGLLGAAAMRLRRSGR